MNPHALALAWDFFWWPETGKWYAFWSSFGACLAYFAIFAVVYRKLNCCARRVLADRAPSCRRNAVHHLS
jgi:hypothetical protein